MRRILPLSILSVLLLFTCFSLFSEGTKQILLNDAGHGKIQVMTSFSPFASYTNGGVSAAPEYRLYIHVENLSETIYYGFGDPLDNDGIIVNDVSYRIKDPSGTIVVGPSPVPLSGTGHISTFASAVAGPSFLAAGGYSALFVSPTQTGDYFIEFNFPSGFGGHDRTKFKYFDITVGSASNSAIDGRVWSKAWQCTADANGASNAFYGKFFPYSNDSVVTSINCNGMAPYVFTIACNQYGCYNTGNFVNDRRSVSGDHIIPQFKIFLNNPDSLVYPTGILGSIIPPVNYRGFCDGTGFIQLQVTKAGNVDIILNINPAPGIQPQDVELSALVSAGMNSIPWNGLDGLGVPVTNGTTFNMILTYIVGLTNLPIYDIDENPNGFIIDLHRPSGAPPLVYWTDALLGGGTQNLTGCSYLLPSTGCHTVTLSVGNNNTINTWWYALTATPAPVLLMVKRATQPLGAITGQDTVCPGSVGIVYSVTPEPNSTSYIWTFSGTGASIHGSGNTVFIDFSLASTNGVLSVKGYNDSCGPGAIPSTKNIVIRQFPGVVLNPFTPVCLDTPPFPLTGGSPAGGTYTISGIPATIFDPAAQGLGSHTVSYTYNDPVTGCTKTVNQPQVVNPYPVVTLAVFPPFCINSPAIPLLGGSPPGGTYTGTGVSGGMFDPSVAGLGTFNITYTYTDGFSCSNSAIRPLTVNPPPAIIFTEILPVCVTAAPFALTNASPAGGTYSGTGVSAGIFDPTAAGAGSHYIVYTYTDTFSCTSKDSTIIVVRPLPGSAGTISGLASVCQGTLNVVYTIPAVANATSYVWTVTPAIAGTITGTTTSMSVNWAAGYSGSAVIRVTGMNTCGSGTVSPGYTVTINPKPVVTFSYCFDSITSSNAKPFILRGGIPLGGTYTGTGVVPATNTFIPSVGTGTRMVTYTYTNSLTCSGAVQKGIIVVAAPVFACGNKFTDIRDNQKYNSVFINGQCWMAVNLNYGHTRTSDQTQRDNCTVEKYCYSDIPANCATYGGLYQWDEVMQYTETADGQGLCPPGWHLPKESEWILLFKNYINNGFAAAALKTSGYSGFNADPDGMVFFNRSWNFLNFATMFWTSDSHGPYKAWAYAMNSPDPSVAFYPGSRSNAFSVRCLKD